jgi:hypothetical protein
MKFLLKNPGFCGGGPINFSKKAPLPTGPLDYLLPNFFCKSRAGEKNNPDEPYYHSTTV